MTDIRTAPGLLPAAEADLIDGVDAPILDFGGEAASEVISRFEEQLGGRDVLVGELISTPEPSPRLLSLLHLAFDPRFATKPLGWLCAKAGIAPGEVFLVMREAMAAKATVVAMKTIADRAPRIATELFDKALDHREPCLTCDGVGTILRLRMRKGQSVEVSEPCKPCKGKGQVFVRGSLEVQKLALDIIGLLKKPGIGGTTVQVGVSQTTIQQPASQQQALGGLAQLQRAVGGILFEHATRVTPTAPTIDVVPVEEGSDGT